MDDILARAPPHRPGDDDDAVEEDDDVYLTYDEEFAAFEEYERRVAFGEDAWHAAHDLWLV